MNKRGSVCKEQDIFYPVVAGKYREAVAETCRVCIARITPPFQAIRYAEAMDRRDFIFDVLLEEAEFYLIGGGNG